MPLPTRRDLLNDYLQHELRLAATGPDSAAAARTYLQGAYSPLGNAAWGWDFGFGWTMVALDQMQDFVSAQTYALRFDGSTRNTEDRWGLRGHLATRSAWHRESSAPRPACCSTGWPPRCATRRCRSSPAIRARARAACRRRTRGVSGSWQARR